MTIDNTASSGTVSLEADHPSQVTSLSLAQAQEEEKDLKLPTGNDFSHAAFVEANIGSSVKLTIVREDRLSSVIKGLVKSVHQGEGSKVAILRTQEKSSVLLDCSKIVHIETSKVRVESEAGIKSLVDCDASPKNCDVSSKDCDTSPIDCDSTPLLLATEKQKSTIFRFLSGGACAALFLNGLHMLTIGLNKNTEDLISQDTPFCPAEPLLPSYQIKVGSWLCLATFVRLTGCMLSFFIFTQLYYHNNQSFSRGKCFYFFGHSLLLLFDVSNLAVFLFFTTIYFDMFTSSLKPGDVELSVAGEDLYCDLGLYLSAMVGYVLMCILVGFAFTMLIIHSISIFNIFRRFWRGEEIVVTDGMEMKCMKNKIVEKV